MAVRTKGRRKIVVDGRHYIWYVTERHDTGGDELRVVAGDKSIHATYPMLSRFPLVFLSGKGIAEDFRHHWVRCPRFEIESAITPQSVKNLIQWALSNDKQLIRVDYWGNPI